jgi:prevent-host-death family protein
MKLSNSVKPVSYLKTNISKIINDISENTETIVITVNGEAKAVILDITAYEKIQDTLNLLKILSISSGNLKRGNYKSLSETKKTLNRKIKDFRK